MDNEIFAMILRGSCVSIFRAFSSQENSRKVFPKHRPLRLIKYLFWAPYLDVVGTLRTARENARGALLAKDQKDHPRAENVN